MERPTARGRADERGGSTSALLVAGLLACVAVPVCLLTHAVASGARPSTTGLIAVLAALPGFGIAAVRLCRRWSVPFHTRAAMLTAAGALLCGQGLLALTPQARPDRACLPIMGRGARIGVELALLHGDPACPSGQLVPSSTVGAAYALVCLALSLLAVHGLTVVLLGVATATLLGVLVLDVARVGAVLARPTAAAVLGPRQGPHPAAWPRLSAAGRCLTVAPRRGPPRALPA